jgi:glycosyltransferase involved in cell wall biosynthesis
MTQAPSNRKLAIIVAAFKSEYLAKALACLARQTDQRFTLYVVDDASPADIQGIARSSLGARPYIFKRFETNLGGKSLAKHWDRCVAVSNEPWVWLFSDDDLMDDNCVEMLNKFLETEGDSADIVRFNAWIVDESDAVTGLHTLHLESETWLEYGYGHFMNWRRTFMQQLIFRRSAFDDSGGFLDLPLCWGTDDAIVIALGRHARRPIRRVPGARMYWRLSLQNITPDRSLSKRKEKLRANCLFVHWFDSLLKAPRDNMFPNDDAAFRSAMDRYLVQQVMIEGALPAIANWKLLSSTRVEMCHASRTSLIKYILVVAVSDAITAVAQATKKLMGLSGR